MSGSIMQHSVEHILYIVRWVIIIGVYLESRLQFTNARLDRVEIRIAVFVIAALTIAAHFIPENWVTKKISAFGAIVDIGFVTVVIFFSDGIQSPFYPLYYVTVISVASEFGSKGAITASFVITLLSLGAEIHDANGKITGFLVFEDVIKTIPYLFLVAIITGYLRDRIIELSRNTALLQAEHDAVEREMEIARKVERAQLPVRIPNRDNVEFVVFYRPANEIGGDSYDFYPVNDDSIGINIADASGKGVPAALLVTSTKYAIREHYSDNYSEMMHEINKDLISSTTADTFVTMIFGMLFTTTMELKFVNAGHMPPIVIKGGSGEIIKYEKVDPPLGIAEIDTYSEQSIKLNDGDTVVFYTDGITDALCSGICGYDEFEDFLLEIKDLPLENWNKHFAEKLSHPYHLDDATLLVVRVKDSIDAQHK